MKISFARDLDLIREIITDKDMWDEMAEDGAKPSDLTVENTPFSFWLLAKTDEICGVILVNVDTSISLRAHPHMLKDHAGKGGFMMREFFRWFLSETADISNKLNLSTPTFNESGYKLALKLGFTDEGLNRQSYLKNGQIFDQHILGITRDEIKRVIKCQQ